MSSYFWPEHLGINHMIFLNAKTKLSNPLLRLNYFFSSYNGWLTDMANRTTENCTARDEAVIISTSFTFNQTSRPLMFID